MAEHRRTGQRRSIDELRYAVRRFFSLAAGLLAEAMRKPGRNTVLLPYRLFRLVLLGVNYVRQRREASRRRQEVREAMASRDWPRAYELMQHSDEYAEARVRVASMLPRLEYGSLNGGVALWETRWREASPDRRVLMVAPKDFAGSMYKLAEAMNRYSEYAVRLVAFEFHQFDYPVDLVVPECDDARREAVLELADQAAVLHLKDEHSWFVRHSSFLNLRLLNEMFFSDTFIHTPSVFTHYGGYARKLKHDESYIARVREFEGRVAFTPDLDFDWFEGHYVPHAIDTDAIAESWGDCSVLAHSPSTQDQRKATGMLREAVALLKKEHRDVWGNWSVDIIHGVSHAECMQRKGRASLFFDQAGTHRGTGLGTDDVIGWYGNSAIEAMVSGIPTIAHLSDIALELAEKGGYPVHESPIINTPRTVEGLAEAILSFARRSPEERKALSRRTREFTVEFHGYRAVAARMGKVYDELATGRTAPKEGPEIRR